MNNKYLEKELLIDILKEDPCDTIQHTGGCESCPYSHLMEITEINTEEEIGLAIGEQTCFEARYADHLLKKGVIVPPCKVTDKVYFTGCGAVEELTVRKIAIEVDEVMSGFVTADRPGGFCEVLAFSDFGTTAFKSKEEAYDSLCSKEN